LKYVRTNTADLYFLFVFCTTLLFSTCQKAAIVFFTEYKISLIHSTARWRRPCIANPERRIDKGEHTHASFAWIGTLASSWVKKQLRKIILIHYLNEKDTHVSFQDWDFPMFKKITWMKENHFWSTSPGQFLL